MLPARRRMLWLTLLALALLPATAVHASPSDTWVPWAASPSDAWVRSLDFVGPLLFGASEDDGVFVSPTSAGPWTQQNSGLDPSGAKSVRQVVSNSGNLYAATTAGLFRSAGGVGAWTQIGIGDPPRRLIQGGIQSIVLNSPTDMVVAVAGASPSGIFYSSDGGDHWDRAGGLPATENVFYMTTGPLGTPIYAASDDGVMISLNQGRSWTVSSDGIPPSESVFRIAVDPASPTHLFASTGSSVYRSYTGGLTWTEAAGGTLPGAGAKEAFLLAPSLGGQFGQHHAIVGTGAGVYATVDDGDTWGSMSTNVVGSPGLMASRIVWSLGLGFSPPALLAGTQGFGVYALPLSPVTAAAFAVSPSSSLKQGSLLAPILGGFGGTLPLFFTYQWKKCTTVGCTPSTDIAGATGSTYIVSSADINANTRFAVRVCAINLVSPSAVCATSSATTAGVAGPPGSAPKPSSGQVLSPNPNVSYPWGQTFTISNGSWRTESSASIIAPDSFTYRWQRCNQSDICTDIPGATGPTYTATDDDVGDYIAAFIGATKAGVSSELYLVSTTFTLIEKTPVNTDKPKIIGDALTGTVMSSTAGGWDAHDPSFTRRWLRCNSDGVQCNPPSPEQTGSTYTVGADDLGSRLELEITATVIDPSQNRVTTVTSDPTAVIADPPAPAGGGGDPGGGGTPGGGTAAVPQLSGAKLGSSKLTAKHPLVVTVTSSAAGRLRVVVQRLGKGRRVAKHCVRPTRKNRRKPACTRATTVAAMLRAISAGATKITIPRTIGKTKLPKGRYRLVLTPLDAAGHPGAARTIGFRVA